MPFYEREEQILKLLEGEGAELSDLAKRLFISLPTLRRDLIKLEKKGLITRSHGKCALKKKSPDEKIPFSLRSEEGSEAKIKMARAAAELVQDGDTVMLDASTSAYNIIPYLAEKKNILVITSGAKAAILLAHYGIKNISSGGIMINSSFSYTGADAIASISRYNADIAFFSCRALSDSGEPSDNSIEENDIRRAMMRNSKRRYLLADGRKIGKTCLNKLCEPSELDGIISDARLPEGIKLKNP